MDEEELEEFVREPFVIEEFDLDYEFDAARFYDFTRAESDCEIREAERWFESAKGYPPSPFIMRLNWQKGMPVGVVNTSLQSKDVKTNNRGFNNQIIKAKAKSTISRSSTLMKPTASHLAKQNQFQLVHSIRSLRLQKKLGNTDDKSSQNSSVTDDLATKRQKLEAGFLSKVAQLKHQALLSHKVPKNLQNNGLSENVKPKATIPREPVLETAHRAERRRNKLNAESGEPTNPNAHMFKARPLNRKILRAPLALLRRSEPQLPEIHETNMPWHNSENTEEKRSNSGNGLRQEKCQTACNFEDCSPRPKKLPHNGKICAFRNTRQRSNFSTSKEFQDEPPIHLFTKLCLTSKAQENTRPQSESLLPIRGTREKTPYSFYKEHEVSNIAKERSQRLGGMDFVDCGRDRRIHELQLCINRSSDMLRSWV